MSGPVQPPLTVETIDGTTSGRPITTIKVTNGDLTVSGNIATIDTSGGGGGGGMTSFDLAGDSGATQSIGNGDTLSVLGGTGLASVASATDTVTLNISNTLVSGATPNYYDALTINAQGQVTAVAAGTAPQAAITLTTTGTSGAATLVGATLNIPQYSGGGGGSPAGSNKEIQYNNSGSFGASSAFTWDESDKSLIINDDLGGGGISLRVQSETNEVPVAHFQTKTSTTNATSQVLKLGAGLTAGSRAAGYGASLAFYVADEGFGGFKSGEIRTVWIDSDSNSDMVLEASGTGNIGLEGVRVIVGSGTNSGIVTSNGAYDLILDTNSGTNSGTITITDGTNGNITVNPNGTGTVGMGNFVFDVDQTVSASEDAYVLTYTDSSGEISLKEAGGGGGGSGNMGDWVGTNDILDFDSNTTRGWTTYFPLFPVSKYSQPSSATVGLSATSSYAYPFYARATGAVTDITIRVITSGTDQAYYAIYDTGADGWMDSLLGLAKPATSSTGVKTDTTFYETDGATTTTITLTKGSLYWVVYSCLGGDTSLPEVASQMDGTYFCSTNPPSYYLNGGGYNPMGAANFRISASQGTTVTTVFPSTMTDIGSLHELSWGNGAGYDLPPIFTIRN